MGLHLHTRQDCDRAEIEVRGEIGGSSLAQLEAAIEHFRSRGCAIIDVTLIPTVQRARTRGPVVAELVPDNRFAIRQV